MPPGFIDKKLVFCAPARTERCAGQLIAIGEQHVRLRLPEGARVRRVRLLAADKRPHAERAGQYLRVTVPSILDHEIVAIDL